MLPVATSYERYYNQLMSSKLEITEEKLKTVIKAAFELGVDFEKGRVLFNLSSENAEATKNHQINAALEVTKLALKIKPAN